MRPSSILFGLVFLVGCNVPHTVVTTTEQTASGVADTEAVKLPHGGTSQALTRVYPWQALFSPDGRLLFVWYAPDPTPPPWFTRLRVWETDTGNRVGEFRDGPAERF